MFCCVLLCVHSSIAIILMGKGELVALLVLSSWCLVMVERLFLALPRGCLRFTIVVFPDHTHKLFLWSADLLAFFVCEFFLCFCYSTIWCPGSGLVLIVSIPDRWPLSFLVPFKFW